jgi:lipoprotein NlpD
MHLRSLPWYLACLATLGGCASSGHRAPVEERAPTPRAAVAPAPVPASATPATSASDPKPLPNAEHAGKPGYYTVKPGDTLIRVALENGQNWRDVARWSGIDNPNVIEVGQVLRVLPPMQDATAVASRGVGSGKVEARGLEAKPEPLPASVAAGSATAPAAAAAAAPAASAAAVPASVPNPAMAREGEEEPQWAWPAAGALGGGFEEGRSKGLAILGKAGDPVLAAADGRVVYAGSGLRGYGNLVIVKHSNTYLTAYAHNQALVVKEDQVVRRGQRIADMGATDSDRVQLHFEIRKHGKPVDPAKLLPPR